MQTLQRLAALGALASMAGAWAQEDPIIPDITTQEVVPGIYMLIGMGGNMGLSVGEATFLIDDQYAPINKKIKAAVAELTNQPVKFVLNTHHHADHTGGNEAFGKSGAIIVAHDNVRTRMSAAQVVSFFNMEVPAAPAIALPVLTFDNTTTFHVNGQTISGISRAQCPHGRRHHRAFQGSQCHAHGRYLFFQQLSVLRSG